MREHYEKTRNAMCNLLKEILSMYDVMPDELRSNYYLPMSGLIENFSFILNQMNKEIPPWN